MTYLQNVASTRQLHRHDSQWLLTHGLFWAAESAPIQLSGVHPMSFFSLHGRPTVKTKYKDIPECTTPGLHAAIFNRFAKIIPTGSAVIDLASGIGAWAQRM